MRTLKLIVVLVILIALFGCTQKSPLSPDRPVRNIVTEDSGSITGFVILKSDSGDTDFSGAEVILTNSGKLTYSEKNGFFKFDGIQPDTYSIKVRKTYYESEYIPEISVGKGANVYLSSITMMPDISLPPPPTNLSASLSKGKVFLTWNDPATEEDITYYIFRSTYVLTNLTNVSTDILNKNLIASDIRKGLGNYVVSAVNDSRTYIYTLASMDYSRNLCDTPPNSTVFESSDTLAGDYIAPAGPISVKALADDRFISIQIEQPYDFDIYYSLLYMMDANADTADLAIANIIDSIRYYPDQRLYSSAFYKTFYNTGSVIYAVQNLDERSYSEIINDINNYYNYLSDGTKKISSWTTINKNNLVLSDTLTLSVLEGVLVPPSNVSVYLFNKSPKATLEWYSPVIEGIAPGFMEYNIYRSTSPTDGFRKLDTGTVSQLAGHYAFIDEGINNSSRYYYYKLSSIYGNFESVLSQPFSLYIPDNPVSPVKPLLESIELENGYVILYFIGPLSEGAGFYNIYRKAAGEKDYIRIQEKVYPSRYDNYVSYCYDYNISAKGSYYHYRVSALDLSGLESILSDSMEIYIPADIALKAPLNNASVADTIPSFSWDGVSGAASYTIEVFPGSPSYSPAYTRAPTGGLPPQLDGWVQRCIKNTSISFGERVDALPEIEPTDQTLVRGRRYYWRVTAYDTDNEAVLNSADADKHVVGKTPLEWSFTYDLP